MPDPGQTALPAAPPAPVAARRAVSRRCVECAATYKPAAYNQMFCSTAHKRSFHKRQEARGAVLTPLAMAARLTRDGTEGDKETGKRARRDSRSLMSLWAAEDKAAGRPSMVDYVAQRYALALLTRLDV